MTLEIPPAYLKKKISSSVIAFELITEAFKNFDAIDRDKEHFFSIALRRNSTLLYIELISTGTLTGTLVHVREVYRRAILNAAHSLVVFHNHPSGNILPSVEDDLITKKLKDAGKLIGIQITDHIIFAEEFYSYADEGKL